MLHPDRCFSPDPSQRASARELYQSIKDLPLVCPHSHVDPHLFADPDFQFGSATEILLVPDHYVFRMLYSQGLALEKFYIPPAPSGSRAGDMSDPRAAWQLFADNFHLFCGTPTGIWLADEFCNVFGIIEKLSSSNAQDIYDHIGAQLKSPAFKPRALFKQFNIEVLCTTDAATDTLIHHQAIRDSGWEGRILPTFRPDTVINLDTPDWHANIDKLSAISGITITNYQSFIAALENRREFFKEMGARASDHTARTALTLELTHVAADAIFQRALKGQATPEDTTHFTAHMLIEMARMSTEDGLVMQFHVGVFRSHNKEILQRFGPDMGVNIPVRTEFTCNLKPLLDRFGSNPRLTLILFNLDESNYARELAPLAGHYPALKLGPPWWFHDSLNGMQRYFDQVMETAGLYNTAGFNDDTRSLPSLPARHDLWRRAACDWAAGLLVRHIIDESDAHEMVRALAYDLVKDTYNL